MLNIWEGFVTFLWKMVLLNDRVAITRW